MSEKKIQALARRWPPNGDAVDVAMNIRCHKCLEPLASAFPGVIFQAYGLALCEKCLRSLLGLFTPPDKDLPNQQGDKK